MSSPSLTQLRPTVPVIGYCAADRAASRDVLALARAGVHDVMFHGADDRCRVVRRFIDTATTTGGVDDILRAIAPGLNVTLLPLVRYCLENPQVTCRTTRPPAKRSGRLSRGTRRGGRRE